MSILIKGMEMPKNCGECSFLQESVWRGKMFPCVCVAGGFVVKPSETDLKDGLCPLVELPEKHGRLIDAAELKTAFPRCDNNMDIKIASVRATVNHMPTIIEAEEV